MMLRRALLGIAVAVTMSGVVPTPVQGYLECGYFFFDGGYVPDSYVWAEATVIVDYPGCFGEYYDGVHSLAQAQATTPWGTTGWSESMSYYGEAIATAYAPLQSGESGSGSAWGLGRICFDEQDCSWDVGAGPVYVPPGEDDPPEPPSTSNVSGVVFRDNNENGVPDGGDDMLPGMTVYLTDWEENYTYDTRTTNSAGEYVFGGLTEGDYRVTHDVPAGYIRTTDDSRPFTVPPDLSHNFGIALQVSCSNPPLSGINGPNQGRTISYNIINAMTGDESAGVGDGFANWSSKNSQTGLNVTYQLSNGAAPPLGITVEKGDPGSSGGLPNFSSMVIVLSANRAMGGTMVITNDTSKAFGRDAFRRLTQHELGHFHGLDHASGAASQSTVMRTPITTMAASLANSVTDCDAQRAYEAR
jgi:hypothetical protein